MTPAQQVDLLTPLFRVLAWMRYVLLGLTVMVLAARLDEATRPALVVAAVVIMAGWTVFTQRAYAHPERRTGWVGGLDLGITLVLCAISPAVLGPNQLPLTGFWSAGAPMAVAIARGWVAGGLAALALCLTYFYHHPDPRAEVWGLLLSLIIGAAGLGFMVDRLRAVTPERDRLNASAAVLAERERLARIVHDGVLQVLAMVEREGPNLGPRGMLLARLARQQEGQLRALIQDRDVDPAEHDLHDGTHRSFAVTLDRHASATVTVSTPAEPVLIESSRAAELDAAVSEALKNVAKHAGPDARAWVLLEVEDSEIVVSIRDNGVGGNSREFAAAMHNGRFGMKHSIYGRIEDLGGKAALRTAPGRGVEWELRVPLEP